MDAIYLVDVADNGGIGTARQQQQRTGDATAQTRLACVRVPTRSALRSCAKAATATDPFGGREAAKMAPYLIGAAYVIDGPFDKNSSVVLTLAMTCDQMRSMLCKIKVAVATCILIVLVALLRVDHAVSQLLSAYDQAYGRWRATLRKGFFRRHWSNNEGDLQLLFPANNNSTAQAADLARQPVSSVTCDLSLERNGRFCLALSGSTAAHPLRGEYYLTPNPYCVTDRWYDELALRIWLCQSNHGVGTRQMSRENDTRSNADAKGARGPSRQRRDKKAPTERKVIGTFSALPIPVHSNVELEFSDGEDDDSVGDNFDGLGTLTPLTDNI
ncbi:hypothetical protein THAOC_03239 [Thalassiosira oceanica]|uniref:Uncharacterized protein n=1 Tax=Thalassiosira oceanica TaxID=159749 RepID=K0TL70_THAOC|nr:hypothetical protein THAOC_03239 [Thalassiosira oceanica]|eukprot:EJK75051.1 hypothetical protein THAOC_03239 [Thalassiosira oceanica]